MWRNGQHLADTIDAPYQMPRPCDHCAKQLLEAELLPFPKTNSYLVHAPELLCAACWQRTQRRTSRRQDYKEISDRCLINHNLQQNVSKDVTICTACGESCLPGTNMFECITCDDMWTYCVDCKLASDLRPSYNQRQHNAQARARGNVLYQFIPWRQALKRSMPSVEEKQQEDIKETREQGEETQGEDNMVTALTLWIMEELASHFVDIAGNSLRHARILMRTQQRKLETAFRAHLATLDSEERVVKKRFELFNVPIATSSSSTRRRWGRSRGT